MGRIGTNHGGSEPGSGFIDSEPDPTRNIREFYPDPSSTASRSEIR